MNKIVKTNTVSPFLDSFSYLDTIFDDTFSSMLTSPLRKSFLTLKTDYFIENGELTLNVDVPGSVSEDVIVDFNKENYVLSVKVAKQYEKKESKPNFFVRERVISNQARSFRLPQDIDTQSISAKVENGLLTVKAKIKQHEPSDSNVVIKVN